jgi:excinuclease UvrABC nuclease subunit
MKGYVYRFLNNQGDIIYVGKTNDMKRRMRQHFLRGHLPKECYKKTNEVQYIKFKSELESSIYEIYYINKFKPIFNKKDKFRTLDVPEILKENHNWSKYNTVFTLNKACTPINNNEKFIQGAYCLLLYILVIMIFVI